jgi:hypothetical protein
MKESAMHPSLKQFITQYVAVVAAALIPVSFVAFLSMPFDLGGHPGEGRTNAPLAAHFS